MGPRIAAVANADYFTVDKIFFKGKAIVSPHGYSIVVEIIFSTTYGTCRCGSG